MTGGINHIETPRVPSAKPEKSMTLPRYLLIITNIAFGIIYVILTIWQSIINWFYVIPVPFYFLMLWVSYRSKLSEFDRLHIRGIHPELNILLHIVGLIMNLVLLIMLMSAIIFEPTMDFFIFVVPIFMATIINFENLGSFLAYNQVTKNN